jgi:hypothetical protein
MESVLNYENIVNITKNITSKPNDGKAMWSFKPS